MCFLCFVCVFSDMAPQLEDLAEKTHAAPLSGIDKLDRAGDLQTHAAQRNDPQAAARYPSRPLSSPLSFQLILINILIYD